MKKILFKLNSLILAIFLIFSNCSYVFANDQKSYLDTLEGRKNITGRTDRVLMMYDAYKGLLESMGIQYSYFDDMEKDFDDVMETMKLNLGEFHDFCYDFTVRKLFQGKENINQLVENKVIKDNKTFGEMYNRFSNIIFNTLNKKYYYLKEKPDDIINRNYEYMFRQGKYLDYKDSYHFTNKFKFNIIDVETFTFNMNEIKSSNIQRQTKFGPTLKFYSSNVNIQNDRILSAQFKASIYATWWQSSMYQSDYKLKSFNPNTYKSYKADEPGFGFKSSNEFPSNIFYYNYDQTGFFLNKVIFNLFKCEYYHTQSKSTRTFYIGDFTNDYNQIKNWLSVIGLCLNENYYGIDFDYETKPINDYDKIKNVQPLKSQYVMRPYNKNYYTTEINHNFDTSDLQKNITDYINEHLKSYDLRKDFENGMNDLESNYDYNSAIISDNQVKLSSQLTDLQNNFNEQYNYLNDLLNDFIDNKYRKQQQELFDKLDKLNENVDNNKVILKENNEVLKSYSSEIKGLDEDLQILTLNSENNYKILNKKVDNIYEKLNNLGDVSTPKSDIDLSEIKRLNDRIKEINEQDPKDRIGDGISMFDKFIKFFKDFFNVTEEFNFDKINSELIYKKIPFSIFYDITSIIQKLTVLPKVPKFEIPIYTETIVVDFEKFEDLAVIVRSFILLYVVIFLVMKIYKR